MSFIEEVLFKFLKFETMKVQEMKIKTFPPSFQHFAIWPNVNFSNILKRNVNWPKCQ